MESTHTNDISSHRGRLYVVAAPSGAGKTSLVRHVAATDPDVVISVSHTTRLPRPGEEDGVHYHFVDEARFRAMVESDALLEHARVFGNYYGTSREWVLRHLGMGLDIILEIDWQGARQVRENISDCVGVFILPPSRVTLEQRLRERGQDSETVVARRMTDAKAQLSHYGEFDYVIINDDFAQAAEDFMAVFRAARLRREFQAWRHRALITALLE